MDFTYSLLDRIYHLRIQMTNSDTVNGLTMSMLTATHLDIEDGLDHILIEEAIRAALRRITPDFDAAGTHDYLSGNFVSLVISA